ncbi:Tol protein-like protein [Colletotrichum higginsianum IMI 349063]|uniref:Tol protein-like protein n=4 Tax=Colletotrichum higginsianum TaxID=80884 RepID=A0A1B7XRT5_COLHI|nr:Tol protein-like protein [Colletotrichum higginsianum IMI 349063]OBR02460.1 Tol protein-like protein [Colletotrichum higginsianum IMI 349063]TID07006.1 hypothetical protein CH35J_000206 [Colletotrichum higginsianum]GJD00435.1 TOL protein-like protein [Colletotrichum higginsianum]
MSDAPASPDNTSNQPPDTAPATHDDLGDLFQRRGAKLLADREARRDEKKHDVDMLSDRDLERLAIRLKSDTEPEDHRVVAKATVEQRTRFEQYKHHSFVKRWEPLSSDAPLDDEWFITDPEILPENHPGYLCHMCRHLNFGVLFTQRGIPGNNVPSMPTQIKIHGLWKLMQDDGNTCAFCGLLRRKIVEVGSLSQMDEDSIRDGQFYINVIDEGPEYALKLEILLQGEGRTVERFVVQRVEEKPQQPLAGTFVRQHQANMDRLRQWIKACEGTHQPSEESPDLNLPSLRVIDTDEFRVREVETPCRYACLSYVWGKGSQTQYTTATRDSLDAPNGLQMVELPQTIKDAIKVTNEAGLRYLWVDALCILQDDPVDKAKIISKMGPIYGGATLTIVASANADPHEGLPGMGAAPRSIAQDVAKVQGLTLAIGLHDPRQPVHDIERSAWSSRAWTFQERALSARCVYFTDSQMVFKCVHSAVMLEETVPVPDPAFQHATIEDQSQSDLIASLWSHPSLSQFANKGFSSSRDEDAVIMITEDIDIEAFMKMGLKERREIAPVFDIVVDPPRDFMDSLGDTGELRTPWDLYRRAVDDYTKRKLSWESDAVNAFAGVEHIVRRGINTKFWFGLPSFAFEQALLWQAREPLQLRLQNDAPIFPSWSWAAWQGQVFYRGRGWKNSLLWDPAPVIRWLVEETPQWFIDRYRAMDDPTEEEVEAYAQEVAKARLLLRELDAYTLRHMDTSGRDGWVVSRNEEFNRHIYSHDAYPGVQFTYPVDLPGHNINDLPDMNDVLLFYAHVVPITSCDMEKAPFKMKVEDGFLQLGFNDESRSSNYRRPWQRIVYHQGYRAGFLTLNSGRCVPPDDDGREYHLAAISRGSLPRVVPPPAGWDQYWDADPRGIQEFVFSEEWRREPDEALAGMLDETTEPSTRPQNEDGDPHWDEQRFGGTAVLDVYDVLLLMTSSNGLSRRLGAGKISYRAFSVARPKTMLVKLA